MSVRWQGPERRREARAAVSGDAVARFEIRARVRVLDISENGVSLSSDTRLPVGTAGHLTAIVAGANFAPEVQIRRVGESGSPERPFELGAVFVAMDPGSRRSLETLLRKTAE